MTCDDKKYLITPSQNVPGAVGPAGPQGPPGPGFEAGDLTASDILVTNPGYANVQEVLDALLYEALAINSFTTPTSIYEIGTTLNSLTVNWTLNRDPSSQSISGTSLPVPPTLVPADRSAVLTLSSLSPVTVGDGGTYTLLATDGTTSPTANLNVTFLNGFYFGDALEPGLVDSAWIIANLSRTLQAGRTKTFTTTSSGGQYAWFAHRAALGTATVVVGGFSGGFEAPDTVSFTNQSGFTEDYYVYRSNNFNIGPVEVEVT